MDTKSKSDLSYMEQKELLKLINDETIVIKPVDKGGGGGGCSVYLNRSLPKHDKHRNI